MDDPIADRLETARRLGERAALTALARYQSPSLDVKAKPDGSLVTEGDFAVNDLLVREVTAAFGEDGILSEEMPEREGTSGYRWVIDPIDGTSSYARGLPTFAILIGIERDRVPVAGVVAMPAIGEMVWGAIGSGAQWRRGDGSVETARVSSKTRLDEATLEAASATAFAKAGCAAIYQSLATAPRKLRGWSEGWAFAMLATGRIDGAVSMNMSRWDIAAFIPLVEEAGGRLTGWDGGPGVEARRMVGATAGLHASILRLVSG